ncbi:unnamed protein product, partial [Brassica rapa subsp. narinosa]
QCWIGFVFDPRNELFGPKAQSKRNLEHEIPELTEPKVSKLSLSPFTVKDIAPPKLPRGHNRQSPKINRHQTLTTAAARDLRRNRSLSLNVLHSIHGGTRTSEKQIAREPPSLLTDPPTPRILASIG